jgi:hypothetical protein
LLQFFGIFATTKDLFGIVVGRERKIHVQTRNRRFNCLLAGASFCSGYLCRDRRGTESSAHNFNSDGNRRLRYYYARRASPLPFLTTSTNICLCFAQFMNLIADQLIIFAFKLVTFHFYGRPIKVFQVACAWSILIVHCVCLIGVCTSNSMPRLGGCF